MDDVEPRPPENAPDPTPPHAAAAQPSPDTGAPTAPVAPDPQQSEPPADGERPSQGIAEGAPPPGDRLPTEARWRSPLTLGASPEPPPWLRPDGDAPVGPAPVPPQTVPPGGARLAGRAARQRPWARYSAAAVAGLAKIKVLLVAASALVSLLAYGLAFGWRFGALFLLILAVHETGHSIAIRLRGLPASLPIFIPFLGALINLRRQPRDAAEEAFIAAAGPAFGLAAAWLLLWLGMQLRAPVFTVAASFGMLVHVFNLLPVTPLDGGRTVAFLRWKAWIPGFIALLVLLFYDPHSHRLVLGDPFAPIILAFIVANIAAEARRRPPAAYDAIPARAKALYAAVWLGLLALAAGGYMLGPRMLAI